VNTCEQILENWFPNNVLSLAIYYGNASVIMNSALWVQKVFGNCRFSVFLGEKFLLDIWVVFIEGC